MSVKLKVTEAEWFLWKPATSLQTVLPSVILTKAPLNKAAVFHPAALLSVWLERCGNAGAPANWNISVSLLQSHLKCSREGKSVAMMRWAGPWGTESCSNSPRPSQQRWRRLEGKEEKLSSKNSWRSLQCLRWRQQLRQKFNRLRKSSCLAEPHCFSCQILPHLWRNVRSVSDFSVLSSERKTQ